MVVFRRLLVNALIGSVTASFLWFAVTFWAYLETKSVLVTSVISGFFGISQAISGLFFGTYVDRHRKYRAMVVSATATAACFAVATTLYLLIERDDLIRLGNPWMWLLLAFIMAGSVAGNLRSIALATCVTLLVPEDRRDRANGMVGTVTGIAFAITSVFSGIVIGRLGMGWALAISVALTAGSLAHLFTIRFDEPDPETLPGASDERRRSFDLKGALEAIHAVPGLMALIGFASFNNLIGGVYMSLLDPYGLSIVSVETWGALWAVISFGFIAGGLIVAKFGLGSRPMRRLLVGNAINWVIAATFSFRSSIIALTIGMFLWLTIMPIIEACEQTVLQRAVPFERQGRVFGFAQTVENAASPIVALSIGPIAQEFVIPFMTDGMGADRIGSWFGTGVDRGLALCFTVTGLIGLVFTAFAFASRSFRLLDERSRSDKNGPGNASGGLESSLPQTGPPEAVSV